MRHHHSVVWRRARARSLASAARLEDVAHDRGEKVKHHDREDEAGGEDPMPDGGPAKRAPPGELAQVVDDQRLDIGLDKGLEPNNPQIPR